MGSHVHLQICTATETFSADFTVIGKLARVYLHVNLQTSCSSKSFLTLCAYKCPSHCIRFVLDCRRMEGLWLRTKQITLA